jgi:hypothetical protein
MGGIAGLSVAMRGLIAARIAATMVAAIDADKMYSKGICCRLMIKPRYLSALALRGCDRTESRS